VLLGCLVGLVLGSFGGNGLWPPLGGEFLGGGVGGALRALIGLGISRTGKFARLLAGLGYSLIYWVFAICLSGGWLLINSFGDCFESAPCQARKHAAIPETLGLLAFSLLAFGVFWLRLALRKERGNASGPNSFPGKVEL
jgi:hypothetical protein